LSELDATGIAAGISILFNAQQPTSNAQQSNQTPPGCHRCLVAGSAL